ncbi:MAG: DUF5057 domain-containing protein [Lachnospiraceae bacterium]|nr:DUF5057 domain-containing protein [Lachnospiraceae bacterium]MDY4164666.1 DUF5057 domain-containing protein [Lachnospiraceae bacterium]
MTPEKDNPLYTTNADSSDSTGNADIDSLDAETGNFGYLISGQEPIDFNGTLENFGLKLTTTGTDSDSNYLTEDKLLDGDKLRDARSKWANKYLKALKDAGIASETKDKAPLQLTGTTDSTSSGDKYYKELKPWEDDQEGETTLDLSALETVSVNGTLHQQEGGSFSPSSYAYQVNTNGSYLQNISYDKSLFKPDTTIDESNVSNYIFYKLQFTKIDIMNLSTDSIDSFFSAAKLGFPIIYKKEQTANGDIYTPDRSATGNFYDLLISDKDSSKFNKALMHHSFNDGYEYYLVTGITDSPVMGSSVSNGSVTLDSLNDYFAAELNTEIPFITVKSIKDTLNNKNYWGTWDMKGYFDSDPSPYYAVYVGKGNGSYDLTTGGSNQVTISYSKIRYVGGYTNNNLFLKHTLDIDDSDIDSLSKKVYVDCVKPENVTEAANNNGQSKNFTDYDLVVISGGLKLFSDPIQYRDESTYGRVDCGQWVPSALKKYLDNKSPLLVDNCALKNKDIKDLLSKKDDSDSFLYMDLNKSDSSENGAVYKNVYVFKNEKGTIASDQYYTDFSENQYKSENSAFKDVYDEINSENALRTSKNPGTTDMLDVDVNEATAIRYIINYAQHRVIKKKATLKVLDIEPESTSFTNSADGYTYYNVSDGTATASNNPKYNLLDEKTSNDFKKSIQAILPDYYTSGKGKVEITTVSTRTLAGLTDDITETYDLVYIGDNRGLRKSYIDTDMNQYSDLKKQSFKNSLVYYNIGDKYWVYNDQYVSLNGMLDKEYNDKKGDKDTYRYSGNDISVKKQKELESFIKQGFPVIVSDGLCKDLSHDEFTKYLGVDMTDHSVSDGNLTISVSPKFFDKDSNNNYNTYEVKNSSGNSIDPSDLVKCTYTLYKYENNNLKKIKDFQGNTFTIQQSDIPKNGGGSYNDYHFLCCVDTATIGGKTFDFTSRSDQPSLKIGVYNNGGGEGCFTPDNTNGDRYKTEYAKVEVSSSKNISVDKVTVDNNTRLYETLDKYIKSGRANVMSYSSGKANSGSVAEFASLSSPEIDMESAPNQYNENDPENPENRIGEYDKNNKLKQETKKLDFKFRIVNETDINPGETTYTAKVYADLNSDGVYNSEDEEITSLTVNKVSGDGASGGEVLSTNLQGGIDNTTAPEYSLSAQLPESLQGAFSWKLVVSENTDDSDTSVDDCPKDSYKGVSFVGLNDKSESGRIKIKILQLNSHTNYSKSNVFNSTPYDLESLMKQDNVKVEANGNKNWFGKELTSDFIKKYYDISIKTIDASTFNDFVSKHPSWKKDYNMLILGFGDNFAGPDATGLKYIKEFIGTGKAVLFCHDNSSYKNLDKDDKTGLTFYNYHNISLDKFTNAFYYNTMLRSESYMDVYGISDSEHTVGNNQKLGGQQHWSKIGSSGILAKADDNSSLTEDIQNDIKKLGYSVAYKPISGGNDIKKTIPEVHGFSDTSTGHRMKLENGIMKSDTSSSDCNNIYKTSGRLNTTKVSQVNKGLITSYPYDINMGGFKNSKNSEKNGFSYTGTKDNMSVSWTHAQWYQLNTNADNIVVWYTVENQNDSKDSYGYNDCINNYYIFNCGNITYTGAGHDDDHPEEVTEDEAKLFVNTMIAAFRATVSKPSAKFVAGEDSDSKIDSTSIQVETDMDGKVINHSTDGSDPLVKAVSTAKIYFKITDNTIAKGKKEGIKLYNKATSSTDEDGKITYTVSEDDHINDDKLKVYDPKTNNSVTYNDLKSGKIYYFTLPTDSKAYQDLTGGKKNSSEIWLVPYNKAGDDKETGDPVKLNITLSKIGLFNLG